MRSVVVTNAGAGYIFEQEGAGWVERKRFDPLTNTSPGMGFGSRVAMRGGNAILSGPYHDCSIANVGCGMVSRFSIVR